MGKETFDDPLTRRIGVEKVSMFAAVAYAHDMNIVHCDIKPENFILFEDDCLRLTCFGIAKVSRLIDRTQSLMLNDDGLQGKPDDLTVAAFRQS